MYLCVWVRGCVCGCGCVCVCVCVCVSVCVSVVYIIYNPAVVEYTVVKSKAILLSVAAGTRTPPSYERSATSTSKCCSVSRVMYRDNLDQRRTMTRICMR
jgi:hypothetical protein